MENKNIAGNIEHELEQIETMQEKSVGILSMITNTCTDLYTVFCC